jgi:hypothetical protein
MAELTKEVDRQREIINGILPAYLRIRETVDRLENNVSRLRQKVRDQDRVLDRQRHIIGVFNERYHDLRTHIYGDDEENDEDKMPDFIRPEEYGPANFGAEEAGPMDLRADNDIGEVRPEEPRDVVVRPSDGTPKEDRAEEARPEDVRPEEPRPKDVQQMGVRPIESFFYWKKKEKRVEGPNDTLQDGEREVNNVSEERGQRTGVTDLAESLDVTGVSVPSVSHVPSHCKEKLKRQLNRLPSPKCCLQQRQQLRYNPRRLLHHKSRQRGPNHISLCPKKVRQL